MYINGIYQYIIIDKIYERDPSTSLEDNKEGKKAKKASSDLIMHATL